MADRVCDVDSKFNLCVVTDHRKWHPKARFLVPILQTNYTFTAYPISLYFGLLKEYRVSKKILRQSEANIIENRDRPTQTPYCGFVFILTCYMFA